MCEGTLHSLAAYDTQQPIRAKRARDRNGNNGRINRGEDVAEAERGCQRHALAPHPDRLLLGEV